jgi:uncharacterized membrane protein YfcA
VAVTLTQVALGLASGLFVGFSLGLVGGGGSILAVPLLVYVVGIRDPHVAIGTSAVAVAANAAVNLFSHHRLGNVIWRCALVFAPSGVAGAWVGSTLGKMIDGQRLLAAFAVLMIVVAGLMLRRSGPENKTVHCHTATVLWLIALGFATGTLSGFFGIGGGFLIVPAIVFATGMPIIIAIGSSLVAVTLFGITTAANYAASGAVDWMSVSLLLIGGVFGGFLGTRAAHALAHRREILSNIFAAVIFIVAVYMLVRTAYA